MAKRADRSKLGLADKAPDGQVLSPREKLAEMYRIVFLGDSGAAVLDDLKKRYGNRRSFVPDSNVTAFHEGQRDVYLLILSLVSRDINRNPNQESND